MVPCICPEPSAAEENTVLYVCVSVVAVVLIIGAVLVVYLMKRNPKKTEEPQMEKNVYYGRDEDEDYYNENDNRVEDMNDYYE